MQPPRAWPFAPPLPAAPLASPGAAARQRRMHSACATALCCSSVVLAPLHRGRIADLQGPCCQPARRRGIGGRPFWTTARWGGFCWRAWGARVAAACPLLVWGWAGVAGAAWGVVLVAERPQTAVVALAPQTVGPPGVAGGDVVHRYTTRTSRSWWSCGSRVSATAGTCCTDDVPAALWEDNRCSNDTTSIVLVRFATRSIEWTTQTNTKFANNIGNHRGSPPPSQYRVDLASATFDSMASMFAQQPVATRPSSQCLVGCVARPAMATPVACITRHAFAPSTSFTPMRGAARRTSRQALYVCMAAAPWKPRNCRLVLEDGSIWKGHSFGAEGTQVGECVFNTSITGYQEIMTDPSYKGQFVVFTHPHIGNVGINQGTCGITRTVHHFSPQTTWKAPRSTSAPSSSTTLASRSPTTAPPRPSTPTSRSRASWAWPTSTRAPSPAAFETRAASWLPSPPTPRCRTTSCWP